MAPRNRLAALRLIDRIKQHELETIGSELSALRGAQSTLERESAALNDQALYEAVNSTTDTRPYLPGFLKSVQQRQQDLTARIEELDAKALQVEARLMTAFRETKTNEMVTAKAARALAEEQNRAEAAQLDDAGRSLFLANRAADKS